MALDVFTNTRTAQQIVASAERRAGGPGYHLNTSGVEDLTAPAYVELQMLLDTLATTENWPFRDDAVSIAVSTRTTVLPPDFWAMVITEAYVIDADTGGRSPLYLLGRKEFFARVTPANSAVGMPSTGTIMKNRGAAAAGTPNGTLIVDLSPDKAYLVEIHYNPIASPLAAITTKPWFPYHEYLVEALLVKLYFAQDDTRADGSRQERDRIMRKIRHAQADPGQRGHQVDYDPLRYRPPLQLA